MLWFGRRLNDNRLTGPIPRDLTGISSLKVVWVLLVLIHFFYPFVFLQMWVMLLCFLFIFSFVNTVIHLKLTLFSGMYQTMIYVGRFLPVDHLSTSPWTSRSLLLFIILFCYHYPFFFWLSNWNYSLTSTVGNTVLFYQYLRSSILTPNYQKMKRVLCLLMEKTKKGFAWLHSCSCLHWCYVCDTVNFPFTSTLRISLIERVIHSIRILGTKQGIYAPLHDEKKR